MTVRTSKVDTYIDHEGPVAEAYRWWGVYLIREKRRLQGISEAVAGGTPLAGDASLDDTQPTLEGIETPDELLTRVDAELSMDDALAELEQTETSEETMPGDTQECKSSGKGALLGRKKRSTEEEDF